MKVQSECSAHTRPDGGVAADGGCTVRHFRAQVEFKESAQGRVGQGHRFPKENGQGFEDSLARMTERAPKHRATEQLQVVEDIASAL